jgi:hypothetical protein
VLERRTKLGELSGTPSENLTLTQETFNLAPSTIRPATTAINALNIAN